MKKFLLFIVLVISSVSFVSAQDYIQESVNKLNYKKSVVENKITFEEFSKSTWVKMLKDAESIEEHDPKYVAEVKKEIEICDKKIASLKKEKQDIQNAIDYRNALRRR